MLKKLDEMGIADNTIVDVLDRQRSAHEQLAGRRDDAVPKREEHELGGGVPGAGDRPLARQDPAGAVSNEIVQHHDWLPDVPGRRWRAGHRREAQGRSHDRGHDLQGPHRRLQPAAVSDREGGSLSPRQGLIYFSDDGDVLAMRFDNWKVVFMEQRVRARCRSGPSRSSRCGCRSYSICVPIRSSGRTSPRTPTRTGCSRTITSCWPLRRWWRSSSPRSRSSRHARRQPASRSTRWWQSSKASSRRDDEHKLLPDPDLDHRGDAVDPGSELPHGEQRSLRRRGPRPHRHSRWVLDGRNTSDEPSICAFRCRDRLCHGRRAAA